MSNTQQDMNMYGWIENATSLNDVFFNTRPFDIIFRSALDNNSLILGNNSNLEAAIYINNNNIGFRKTPSTDYTLDINGNANIPVLNNDTLSIQTSVTCGNKCTINNHGIIENDLIITKNVKNVSNTVLNATIISVLQLSSSEYEVRFQFDSVQDYMYFNTGTYIRVDNIIYKILNKINSFKFILNFVNEQISPFPLSANQNVNIDIMEEIYKQQPTNIAMAFLNIQSFTTISSYKIAFYVTVTSGLNSLLQGTYYTFEGSGINNNIYYMSFFSKRNNDIYEIHLEKTDKTNFNISQFPFSVSGYDLNIKLVVVDTETMYSINESDVSYNSISSTEFTLIKQTHPIEKLLLTDLLTLSDSNMQLPLDTLTIVQGSETTTIDITNYNYDSGVFTAGSGIDILDSTVNIEYVPYGIPFEIVSINTSTNTFVFKDLFNQKQKVRVNDTLYICILDLYVKILDIEYDNNTIYVDTIPATLQTQTGNILYILPYREKSILRISSDDCFIGKKLAIGTETAWETLTVQGDIGIQTGSTVYKDSSNNRFALRYNNSVFDIGGKIQLGDDKTTIYNNTFIRGDCFSENFYNYSDRRIKDNITPSSIESDKSIVQSATVIEYTNKSTKAYTKGFIAQEIEKILPYAVNNNMGVLKSICREFTVTDSGYIILDNLSQDEKQDLTVGTPLHISIDGSAFVSPIIYINNQNTSMYIQLAKDMVPNTNVFIIGPYTTIKSVNYDTMFLSMFNCVKGLLKDVSEIKSILQMS